MQKKMTTFFTTYRRMARLIYKDIHKEESEEKEFGEIEERLTNDIKTGNVELVTADVKSAIGTVTELFELVENGFLFF